MAGVRVASVTFDYYPFDVTVRRLCEAAVDAGHQMDIICIRQEGEPARDSYHGVTIYRLPITRGFGKSLALTALTWVWFTVLASLYLAWLTPRRRYQVIHAHNMPDFVIFAGIVPKLFGARMLLEIQDVSPELLTAKAGASVSGGRGLKRRLAELQERVSTQFADIVATVGWPFEEKLLERGVPKSKLRIIINSADPKVFPASRRFSPEDALRPVTPPHDASAPFIIMYWGTIAQRNGLSTAISALALARREEPALRLDIMGRGEEIARLQAQAEAEGVGDAVRFFGPVPTEEIVDFITHGDVGVIPYFADGFADLVLPTKAYELAWLGRPIIASDTPAIRSLFGAESMVLCPPGDSEAFARAFLDLYRQPEKRRAMVANATADYEPYRWELMAKRYTDLLTWLATTPRAALRRSPREEAA